MNPTLAIASIQRDPSWMKKFIQAGLFSLIPVLGTFFLMGWLLDLIRAALKQNSEPLPEPALLDCLSQGFQVWLILLIYTIPLFLFAIPLWVAPIFSDQLAGLNQTLTLASLIILTLYSGFCMWLLPAILGQFAATGALSSAVQFRHIFGMAFSAPVAFTQTLLITAVSFALAQGGILLCAVGLGFTNALAVLLVAELYAQAYLLSKH